MTLDGLALALAQGAAVVLLAVLGVRLASRVGVPGLLLFLLLGLVAGAVLPGLSVDPQTATVIGYAALVVILAEGGLTTRLDEVRPVLLPAVALATLGVVVSIVVVAVPLVLLLDLQWRTALLLGAVLAATDAAAVFSVLRRLHLRPRLRALLEAEAGFNDAPVIVLVVVLSTAGAAPAQPWLIPLLVVGELVGGALVGLAVGGAGRWLMPRLALPAAGLYPIAVMALLVGAYGLADLLHTSGFLATYLAGLLVGNAPRLPHRRSVVGFAEGLAWSAQIGLFFMLGLLAAPDAVRQALPAAAVAGVVLVVLARPLAALVSLAPFRLPAPWIGFTAFTGLRGAVPIVFAAIPLGEGMPQAQLVFDATLVLVVALTVVQTPWLPWLSHRLGVARGVSPDELEVEAAPLDRVRASLLGFDIPDGSKLAGTYVADLRLPEGAGVSLVVREGRAQVPDQHTRLRTGDQLLVVATEDQVAAVTRRLRRVSEHGRLAGWYEDQGGSGR
jgi:cell volume regulation protein A